MYVADAAIAKVLTGYGVVLDIVALFHRPASRSLDEVLGSTRRLLVFEAVDNPANVGAMVRSAAALGFDGFLVDETSADPLARRSARASMGTVFDLPWARTGAVAPTLHTVREHGFRTIALTPAPDATRLDDVRVTAPERLALVLGSERAGLTDETLAGAERVRIPMHRGVDSLNVAAAAAVACYVLGR